MGKIFLGILPHSGLGSSTTLSQSRLPEDRSASTLPSLLILLYTPTPKLALLRITHSRRIGKLWRGGVFVEDMIHNSRKARNVMEKRKQKIGGILPAQKGE